MTYEAQVSSQRSASRSHLLTNSVKISDLDSYAKAFMKQKGEMQSRTQAAGAAEDDSGDDASEADEDDSDNSEGDDCEGPNDASAPEGTALQSLGNEASGSGQPQATPSKKALASMPPLPGAGGFVSLAGPTFVPSVALHTPPAKRARSAIGFDDSASMVSGSCVGEGTMGDGKSRRGKKHDLQSYMAELSIPEVLRGGKLGVTEHHARLFLSNSIAPESDLLGLRNHLELFELAKKLSPREVGNITGQALDSALREVIVKQGFQAPPALQYHLVDKRLQSLLLRATNKVGTTDLMAVLPP